MTGFGAASLEQGGASVRAELRAVNHRHLQLKTRLPHDLGALEPEVDALVRKKLSRGGMTLTVSMTRPTPGAAVSLNAEAASRYRDLLTELRAQLDLPDELLLSTLLGLPGVVETGAQAEGNGDAERRLVLRVVKGAIEELLEMRATEGELILRDLRKHARGIEKTLGRIEKRAPKVVRDHHAALQRRVQELLGDTEVVSQGDLAREIALLADRLDISEEIARLWSHLSQLDTLLEKGGSVGRKLDFLAQEFLREANTIGSKASDATAQHLVVELKTHIERLREQVQNVE